MQNRRPVTQIFENRYVRRVAHSGSETIQELLIQFRNAGLEFVPMPLSCSSDFEELTYVPGECFSPTESRPELAWSPESLQALGQAIRNCHDCSEDFLGRNRDKIWFPFLENCREPEVICHNDLGPWNVPNTGNGVGIIDWEMASPGCRIWDVAYIAWNWVPFYSLADRKKMGVPSNWSPSERLSILLEGYGKSLWSHEDIYNAALERQHRVIELVKTAQDSNEMLLENWAKVDLDPIRSDMRFLEAHVRSLRSKRHSDDHPSAPSNCGNA